LEKEIAEDKRGIETFLKGLTQKSRPDNFCYKLFFAKLIKLSISFLFERSTSNSPPKNPVAPVIKMFIKLIF